MRRIIASGLAALTFVVGTSFLPAQANSHHPAPQNIDELITSAANAIRMHHGPDIRKACPIEKRDIRDMYYLLMDYQDFGNKVLVKEKEVGAQITNSTIQLYTHLFKEWEEIKTKARTYSLSQVLLDNPACDNVQSLIAERVALQHGYQPEVFLGQMYERGLVLK